MHLIDQWEVLAIHSWVDLAIFVKLRNFQAGRTSNSSSHSHTKTRLKKQTNKQMS